MDSTELARRSHRARLAYELGRIQLALWGSLPIAVVVALALLLAQGAASTLGFGVAAIALGALLLWYGQDAQRAVLPGVAAGVVPLALALCADRIHYCDGESCTTLCLQACAVGGAVAGLAVASVGNRLRAGAWYWVSASLLALLTGAMGCACIGYSGFAGLGVGFFVAILPARLANVGRG